MEIASTGPFRATGLRWLLPNGAPGFTVVCKATFLLQPGETPLAPEQDLPNEEDTYWDDDPKKSLSLATDLVPYKARADVLVVGHTFAPGQAPARSWVARLAIGPVHKAIEVYSERVFGLDGELREGAPVTRVRLRYERAAGGPDSSNPVGMRFDVQNALGMIAIPNLQPPGVFLARRGDTFLPTGFGPIAPGWPDRRIKLHGHAANFGGRGWNHHPMPEGVEAAYFNAAPHDQQLDALHPGERLSLECLHPEHTRLVTRLPSIEPSAVLESPGQPPLPLPLRCDTLWIDTDRAVLHLVWRATLPPKSPVETGRILISRAAEARPLPPTSVVLGDAANPASTTIAPFAGPSSATLPFARQPREDRATSPRPAAHDGALPFSAEGSAPPAPAAARFVIPAGAAADSTVFLFDAAQSPAPPPPAPPPPPPPPPAPVIAALPGVIAAPTSAVPPVKIIAEPPLVTPARPDVVGPTVARSAWASTDAEPPAKRESIGERMAQDLARAESKAVLEKKTAGQPELLGPLAAGEAVAKSAAPAPSAPIVDEKAAKRGWKVAGASTAPSAPLTDLAHAGALAASNAAIPQGNADAPPQRPSAEPRPLPPPREAIELLWLDTACLPRVRRQPAWKELLSQLKPKPLDDEPGADAPAEKKQEARDRREMAVLLARAEPLDPRGLESAMANAVTEDGVFVPPLVLVAGDLTLPFDEVETLKATIAAVTPLIGGDVKLQAAVETAQKLLQTPWLNGGASEIAEGLTVKIKEAFVQANRAVPARYLEHHTERMLLHQRAYQKRTVLGKTCVRGVLGMAGAREGLPVYLPEEAAKELPGLLRFAVRMVGEARGRLEEGEERGAAVRVVGVARLMRG